MWYNGVTSKQIVDRSAAGNGPRSATERIVSMEPHSITTLNEPLKLCSKCGEKKPATAEFFASWKKRGRTGFVAACRECDRARARAWNAKNKERKAATNRNWAANNRERIKRRLRAWHENNREHLRTYRERNRDKTQTYRIASKESAKAWRAAHREESRAIVRRRRAIKLGAQGTHTAKDIQQQFDRQKGKCYYCKVKVGKNYHVDHVIPLVRGGSDGPENLVIACSTCNQRKNKKLPHEWPEGNRLL